MSVPCLRSSDVPHENSMLKTRVWSQSSAKTSSSAHQVVRRDRALELGADVLAGGRGGLLAGVEVRRRQRHLDLLLELAQRREVLVEALPVVAAEPPLEALRVLAHRRQHALAQQRCADRARTRPSFGSAKPGPKMRV